MNEIHTPTLTSESPGHISVQLISVYFFLVAVSETDHHPTKSLLLSHNNSPGGFGKKFGVGGRYFKSVNSDFRRNSRPSRQAVTSLVKKFESTYSLCDVAVLVRQRVGRSVENIAAVETSVANDPNQSIPRRSQELGIAKTTLW
ncbi:histone-lysine N-methyltransferase SETMAR [Trichonephila inaurata madagascariensis]|uniref:Histone-lysine N-methyltransferase SETMAR n=1 Tax=Trichonephila inaurata madagascariensis TaxID=2747483 RepID=A0A8X6IAY0_9ARAC|nr:histone-lysine N-methyltransferase SETMAR [Trichonephila inaurata madagascariensis]